MAKVASDSQDEMQTLVEELIDEAKIEDELFAQVGCTSAELGSSLAFYMDRQDAEVTQAVKANKALVD